MLVWEFDQLLYVQYKHKKQMYVRYVYNAHLKKAKLYYIGLNGKIKQNNDSLNIMMSRRHHKS